MMNRMLFLLAAGLAVLLIGCGSGPFGLMSGESLDGPVMPVPEQWSFESSTTAQLETNPSMPYSVNLSATLIDGQIYINAGDTETTWVQNIERDSNVRLRIDGTVYELQAQRVTDVAEMKRFGAAWTSMSSFMRDPSEFEEAWVYRLSAR